MIETRSWAFHAIGHNVKCEHVANNFVESFNAWIDEERYLPPITMLELIRSKIMELIFTRLQIANRWKGVLTPYVLRRISCLNRVSRHAEVLRAGLYEFHVELNGVKVGVKLDAERCNCGAWALACINSIHVDVVEYCSPYFRIDKWKMTFAKVVYLIPSMQLWPMFEEGDLLQVPLRKRQPGRPRKHMNINVVERKPVSSRALIVTWKICDESGHNRKGCPYNPSKGENKPSKKRKTTHASASSSQCPPSSTPADEPLPQSQLSQL